MVVRDREVDRSSLLSWPTSIGASTWGGAGESRSRRPATHSRLDPCTIVETTTTKKTALKIVFECGTSEESTNVASTIGTAPRSPAQPSSSRSREVKSLNAVDAQTATGRQHEHEQQRERETGRGDGSAAGSGTRAGRGR